MKKIFVLSAVLFLVGAGCNISDEKQEESKELVDIKPVEDIQMQEPIMNEIVIEESLLTLLQKDLNIQTVKLLAVDGSDSSGTAYRLIDEDKSLQHAVVASMPDLPAGVSYEGWLVQPSPLKFFSTGVMEKNENGMWILEYNGDKMGAFPTYLTVVITKETKVDAIPEKHIIEASF